MEQLRLPVWFQVHNKASDPASSETTVDQVLIPAGGSLGWRPMVPVACGTQVRWAASSTPGTLTLIAGLDVGFSGRCSDGLAPRRGRGSWWRRWRWRALGRCGRRPGGTHPNPTIAKIQGTVVDFDGEELPANVILITEVVSGSGADSQAE